MLSKPTLKQNKPRARRDCEKKKKKAHLGKQNKITGQEGNGSDILHRSSDSDIVRIAHKMGFWWVRFREEAIDEIARFLAF